MDVIAAYRDVGSYRGAAAICETTHKTVKRIVEQHEAGGAVLERTPRARNYDEVADLVAVKVAKTWRRRSRELVDRIGEHPGVLGLRLAALPG